MLIHSNQESFATSINLKFSLWENPSICIYNGDPSNEDLSVSVCILEIFNEKLFLDTSNPIICLEIDKNRRLMSDKCDIWVMWREERKMLDKCWKLRTHI